MFRDTSFQSIKQLAKQRVVGANSSNKIFGSYLQADQLGLCRSAYSLRRSKMWAAIGATAFASRAASQKLAPSPLARRASARSFAGGRRLRRRLQRLDRINARTTMRPLSTMPARRSERQQKL